MLRARLHLVGIVCCACAASEPADTAAAEATVGSATKADDPLTSPSGTAADASSASTASTTPTTSPEGGADTTAATTGSPDGTSTGTPTCDKRVVLMGYWPPTNEMLRPWSTNAEQNPDGWVGENWRGLGWDVMAFFPEFPPDGDPTNDAIGQDGAVGSPDFDLRVDYQATSADFWRIVDTWRPAIIITTSRGGDIGWEVEAIEGGHGTDNAGDPSRDWSSDQHGAETFPTQRTIDPRSWDAISTHRQGATVDTGLPVAAIVDATSALGITDVVVDPNTSGDFLSGFLGLHGIYYQQSTAGVLAGGHIHVGFGLPVEDASMLMEATLEAVLLAHPADTAPCP